ncbi:hypothetical protein LH452_15200 [Laribacter hongkongensis]|uniref:hypothetical protein n=1 Tax=Laribacter hongkongensis TaxID=168471 RepID=UPI001EFC992B|nr:hypothetical protein [Laribacter hongkongensis]MCG9060227.1 hypothetical protein [Laribacter hongkongensis]MCG9087324.1 hypothetical protein [Laribacter hongkongensis]
MKKRFTEEQIIGFLREAEAGMPIAEGLRRRQRQQLERNHAAGRKYPQHQFWTGYRTLPVPRPVVKPSSAISAAT